jgi:hypothetical protein
MKNTVILAWTILSLQTALADDRGRGREPFPIRDLDDLPMCLKNLDNANRTVADLQFQLSEVSRRCDDRGRCSRETEELRRDNQRLSETVNRLTFDNNRLQDDNRDLRRQLDDLQNDRRGRTLGFFSYAGCTDFTGKIDLRYVVSSEGRMALEAETAAKQNVASNYSCSRGIVTGETEEIRFTQENNYCVAGCTDFAGKVDQKYIQSGSGRNMTEAKFNAIKAVSKNFSCSRGIQIQACQ